jgi:hypothetical protein
MAAALSIAHHPPPSPPGEPEEDPDDALDLIPETYQTWRTKSGTVIGVTAQLTSGEWIAMTPDDVLTGHENRDDASLSLTLAYMRGKALA